MFLLTVCDQVEKYIEHAKQVSAFLYQQLKLRQIALFWFSPSGIKYCNKRLIGLRVAL